MMKNHVLDFSVLLAIMLIVGAIGFSVDQYFRSQNLDHETIKRINLRLDYMYQDIQKLKEKK